MYSFKEENENYILRNKHKLSLLKVLFCECFVTFKNLIIEKKARVLGVFIS